ncbi:MAG: hypothetical protein V7703_12025 [Hyphomicrobiales bacterium]
MPNTKEPAKRKGNYKPGPGRPPGRKNNNTLALEEAARKAMANIDDAFDGDAHAFLQTVYRDPNMPIEVRIAAAGRALRVEKPVLSAAHSRVDVSVDFGEKLEAARERAREAIKSDSKLINADVASIDVSTAKLNIK